MISKAAVATAVLEVGQLLEAHLGGRELASHLDIFLVIIVVVATTAIAAKHNVRVLCARGLSVLLVELAHEAADGGLCEGLGSGLRLLVVLLLVLGQLAGWELVAIPGPVGMAHRGLFGNVYAANVVAEQLVS